MTNSLFPDLKYKTKLYSRREEVGHDAMVYTTYKHFEEKATSEGKEILEVKTDRQLRSEDAKAYGSMQGSYPDLWIRYRDPISHKEYIDGLEVDIQYDERTIHEKVDRILLGSGEPGSGKTNKEKYDSADSSDSTSPNEKTDRSKTKTETGRSKKDETPVNSLSWYCNRASQVMKVINTFNKIFSDPKSKNAGKAKNLKLFFIDEEGKVHSVNWR